MRVTAKQLMNAINQLPDPIIWNEEERNPAFIVHLPIEVNASSIGNPPNTFTPIGLKFQLDTEKMCWYLDI